MNSDAGRCSQRVNRMTPGNPVRPPLARTRMCDAGVPASSANLLPREPAGLSRLIERVVQLSGVETEHSPCIGVWQSRIRKGRRKSRHEGFGSAIQPAEHLEHSRTLRDRLAPESGDGG
jgi:hypothetical protein